MSDVELVPWPAENRRRLDLSEMGTPRLLIVPADAPPPDVDDVLEDWIRLPVSEGDVRARAQALARRAEAHGLAVPVLDDDGVLHLGDRSVVLPSIEARLAALLLDRIGSVVGREALTRAGWPEDEPTRNLLDVRMMRLRRRLVTLGLTVRTVRHRGYLLAVDR